ncbi:MAG: isoprenylcysteine carboxylmethyltransferase family protein [Sphingobium sp.]
MNRSLVLLYGIACYLVGVVGLVAIIAAMAHILPFGYLWADGGYSINPVVWNVLLILIWGCIHSGMARPGFKSTITKIIPAAAERPTYVLVSGITSVVLTGYWMTVPGQVWLVEQTALVYALWAIFAFGWGFLLAATFAINHFDLFGLRQVFLNFRNEPNPPVPFVKRAMYRYIRHPIQTGVLIGIWATPSMSMTQFVLSVCFSIYIFIGLRFEERDLIAQHGDAYRDYMMEAGKVFPAFGKQHE